MDATFEGQLESARRRFVKDSPTSLTIEDQITPNDSTKMVIWQLMTVADIEVVKSGAILRQDVETRKFVASRYLGIDYFA